MISNVCFKCNELIKDKVIVIINNNTWHEDCLRCSQCNCILENTCYELNNAFLCLEDYFSQKLKKCQRCGIPIFPNEMVHHSLSFVFHQNCFTCKICNKLLIPKDKYFAGSLGSVLICQNDYENNKIEMKKKLFNGVTESKEADSDDSTIISDRINSVNFDQKGEKVHLSNTPSMCLDDEFNSEIEHSIEEVLSSDNDKSSGVRRRTPRTTIKAVQLDSLKSTFALTPKPSRQIREQLAECTGLSMRVIQVWFQNRRSKERRTKLNIQRKTDKYRFSTNLDSNHSSSNIQETDTYESDLQMHLNSGPFNSKNLTKMNNEVLNEARYSSNWFVNRSQEFYNKIV